MREYSKGIRDLRKIVILQSFDLLSENDNIHGFKISQLTLMFRIGVEVQRS